MNTVPFMKYVPILLNSTIDLQHRKDVTVMIMMEARNVSYIAT